MRSTKNEISRILVFQTRPAYPLLLGGAARIAHTLLRALTENSAGVDGLFLGRLTSIKTIDRLSPSSQDWRALNITRMRRDSEWISFDCGYQCRSTIDFEAELQTLISQRPALVWGQLENSNSPLIAARAAGNPTMHYVMDAEFEPSCLQEMAST